MSPTDQPSSEPRAASRRAFLALSGTATATALAGCNALRGDEPAAFAGGDWLTYGNGPTNSNRVDGGLPAPDDHAVVAPADWPYAPPVVHGGVVYFATGRDALAIAADGGEQWSRRLDGEVSGAPAVDPARERLYVPVRVVPTTDGPDPASVTVLSLADGAVRDTFRVGDDAAYGATVDGGDVYVRSASACVRLAPDGTERWRRSLDPLVYDEFNLGDSTATQIAPAVGPDGVYVPDRNALVKLDPATGEERWRVAVGSPYAASVVDDGGVVQTGWQETVAATTAGEVRWRRDLHSRAAAAVGDGAVYVAAHDLHELDAGTGETNWQAHLPSEGTAAPVATDESVLAASSGVRAFRKDASGVLSPDRERWQTSSIAATAYSSPVVAAGRVFVVGAYGLLSLRSGED
ncbi:MAG: PQQ-binding-like beta-propeller repeat protein [Haloarculaceae archaeon]